MHLAVFKFLLISFFCVFGAIGLVLAIISLYVGLIFSSSSNNGKVEYIGEFYSPNKQLKAVEYLYMGGGALGFCDRNLSIQKYDEERPTVDNLPQNVFSARCGVDVTVVWFNEDELEIRYFTKDYLEPGVKLSPEYAHNNVSIEYKGGI